MWDLNYLWLLLVKKVDKSFHKYFKAYWNNR